MTTSQTPSDSPQCGKYDKFNKNTDVLILDESSEVDDPDIKVIRVRGLRKHAIVKFFSWF